MSKLPTLITFHCVKCSTSPSPKQIHRQHGQCLNCMKKSWILIAEYTDVEVEVSSGLSLLGGLSASATSYTNRVMLPGVTAETAMSLTEDLKLVYERVEDHIRTTQREARLATGSKECQILA